MAHEQLEAVIHELSGYFEETEEVLGYHKTLSPNSSLERQVSLLGQFQDALRDQRETVLRIVKTLPIEQARSLQVACGENLGVNEDVKE